MTTEEKIKKLDESIETAHFEISKALAGCSLEIIEAFDKLRRDLGLDK